MQLENKYLVGHFVSDKIRVDLTRESREQERHKVPTWMWYKYTGRSSRIQRRHGNHRESRS